MEGNKQQATSVDVERQPRPIGGGTTGLGRGRRWRAWTEEELTRYAVERRRQYISSLFVAIFLPVMTLVVFFAPFVITSLDRSDRIISWLAALFGVYSSIVCIRAHDRDYGYHPEIPCCPPKSGADLC